jgi:hypothetical protein
VRYEQVNRLPNTMVDDDDDGDGGGGGGGGGDDDNKAYNLTHVPHTNVNSRPTKIH